MVPLRGGAAGALPLTRHPAGRLAGLVLVAACHAPTEAELARDAFTRAGQGEIGPCATLADAGLRGFCEYTAVVSEHGATDVAACARIGDPKWRDECGFQRADALSVEGDVVAAVRLCAGAGAFRIDCARHVSVQAYRREGGLSPPFAAALHEVAPELDVAGAWTGQTRHQVYVDRARHADRFDSADCAAVEDPPDCIAATAEVVQLRWQRMAGQNPVAKRLLCAAAERGELPEDPAIAGLRLQWERIPAFDEAVRRAQRAGCGSP